MIFASNQNKNRTDVQTFMNNTLAITRDSYDPDTTPSLSIIAPNHAHSPLLRLGRGSFYYDITRSETSGIGDLEFSGSQAGYGGYTFKTQGGTVKINYDGSVTYGSKTFLSLGTPSNGTTVYCSDCGRTSPCSSGGNGAMAKGLGGNWECD